MVTDTNQTMVLQDKSGSVHATPGSTKSNSVTRMSAAIGFGAQQ